MDNTTTKESHETKCADKREDKTPPRSVFDEYTKKSRLEEANREDGNTIELDAEKDEIIHPSDKEDPTSSETGQCDEGVLVYVFDPGGSKIDSELLETLKSVDEEINDNCKTDGVDETNISNKDVDDMIDREDNDDNDKKDNKDDVEKKDDESREMTNFDDTCLSLPLLAPCLGSWWLVDHCPQFQPSSSRHQ